MLDNLNLSKPRINEFGVDLRVCDIELELLSYIHEFCVSNKINYYLAWWTVLGSQRHKGFIPWDDDIDIALPRKDYDKLLSLADKIDSKYYLATYERTPGYQYNFAKLEYAKSKIVEFNYPNGRHGGIYIDIFPLDSISSDKKLQKKKINKNAIWKIKSNAIHRYHTGVWYLKWFWPFLGFFMRLKYKNNTLLFHRKWEAKILDNSNSSLWVADYFGADMDGVVPFEVFGKPTLMEFCGKYFYGPEKADEYLTYLYGDWKKLPPEEMRHATHGFSFEFL